jgi:hypothetical protein
MRKFLRKVYATVVFLWMLIKMIEFIIDVARKAEQMRNRIIEHWHKVVGG